jgi:hypothetical protein
MGDGSKGGRTLIGWVTIASLIVCLAGLALVRDRGLRPASDDAFQRLVSRVAYRLRGQVMRGRINPEGRRLLESSAASSRSLLLLVTDRRQRIILGAPFSPLLAGKVVDADRASPLYGHVLPEGTDEDERAALERFYPPGHAIAVAEATTEGGERAGYLWAIRGSPPPIAPYAWPALIGGAVYWLALPWWVFGDARARRTRALPFAVLTLVTNAAGWAAYMATRPERAEECARCGEMLAPSFTSCPSCGRPAAGGCPECGAPVREDWRFCPYCAQVLADSLEEDGNTPESGRSSIGIDAGT